MQSLSDTPVNADLNRFRAEAGYLSLEQTQALAKRGNRILDPFSTLISRHAVIGRNNLIYPNTRIEASGPGQVQIGNSNRFYNNTLIDASGGTIFIGDFGRYRGSVTVLANSVLGNGCQVLGAITVTNCRLGDGQPYTYEIADERGSVLKGFGDANGIELERGEVIKGNGTFLIADKKIQSFFHPTVV